MYIYKISNNINGKMEQIAKQCKRCKETKPIEEFHVSKNSKGGRYCWCRDCKKIYDTEYRKNQDKEKKKAWTKQHRKKPEVIARRKRQAIEYQERRLKNPVLKLSSTMSRGNV